MDGDSKFFRIKFGLFGVMVSILAIWIVFLKNLQKRLVIGKLGFWHGWRTSSKINRDTCRFAFKCSAQKYDDKWHDVQKRPLDMSKASKKGRLSLILNEINKYQTIQETSERDILDLVFENGKLIREQTFSEIREIVRRNWV